MLIEFSRRKEIILGQSWQVYSQAIISRSVLLFCLSFIKNLLSIVFFHQFWICLKEIRNAVENEASNKFSWEKYTFSNPMYFAELSNLTDYAMQYNIPIFSKKKKTFHYHQRGMYHNQKPTFGEVNIIPPFHCNKIKLNDQAMQHAFLHSKKKNTFRHHQRRLDHTLETDI